MFWPRLCKRGQGERASTDEAPQAEASQKKTPRARKTVPGSHDPADRGPTEIRLSYDELIELLPFLEKEDKKRLQKQLLKEDREAAFARKHVQPPPWSELPAHVSPRTRAASSSGAQGSSETAKAASLAAKLEPEQHRPKAVIKAEQENGAEACIALASTNMVI